MVLCIMLSTKIRVPLAPSTGLRLGGVTGTECPGAPDKPDGSDGFPNGIRGNGQTVLWG